MPCRSGAGQRDRQATTPAGALAASRSSHASKWLGLRFGEDVDGARLKGNGLSVAQGDPPDPHVRFAGAPAAFGAAVYGQTPLARLEAEHMLEISGDRRFAERLVTPVPTARAVRR